jgi:predicted ATP-dependent serine protease
VKFGVSTDAHAPAITTGELVRRLEERGSQDFLIESLVPDGSLVLFGGEAKEGKSVLVTNLAACVASGRPWLGMNVSQGAVLWCAYEESEFERAKVIAAYEDHASLPIFTWFAHGTYIDCPPDGQEEIKLVEVIRRLKPKLVVIDPLVAACMYTDFDGTGAGRQKLSRLKQLCEEERTNILVIHHLNKDYKQGLGQGRLAGSHQLSATASATWTINGSGDFKKGRTMTLSYRGRTVGHGRLKIFTTGLTDFVRVEEDESDLRSAVLEIMLKEPYRDWKRSQIQEQVTQERSQVTAALNQLISDGRILTKGRSKGTTYRVSPLTPGNESDRGDISMLGVES